ncbi:unnamed protein product [Phaedon cochleariae]|uniref:USP domain-containing protein n=1 Tax=Phaedon cochleariae TaxID=80249 RepID=A0A9N9X5B3_PHACE|nr:unnamed protein product [Phaedon cochleariae]
MEKRKVSYKFSRIPRNPIEQPVPMDLSGEITKLFETKRKKKKRISEYMCESIRKTRLKSSKSLEDASYPMVPSKPITVSDFRKFGENYPISEMSRFEEKCIEYKIAGRGLQKQYPQLLADMMKETKQEYVKLMHCTAMNLRIRSCYPEVLFTIEPYKFIGKTDRYDDFLRTRKSLQNKWILHYPVLRKIHKECVVNLPYELFQISFTKVNSLSELEYLFKDKSQRASQFIYEFYLNIISIVDKEETKHKDKYPSRSYLAASTGLLSLHISRSIAHTLLKIVRVTSADDTKPYLKLEVFFEKQLLLSPDASEVIEAYHNFMDRIIDIGKEVYVLERNKIRGYENKFINLCLTDDFISQCKDKIKRNINKHYEPVLAYIEDLNSKFLVIYADIDSQLFYDSIADIRFEAGCTKINYYRNYLHKVMFIPDHEFVRIGKMFLDSYRETLHKGLGKNISSIFQILCDQHYREVSDLCKTFSTIQERATDTPRTTEELIETGKFMTWIKNENLPELNARVHNSLLSLCQIIDLGILTEDHMRLNARAIKWLDDILPILENHSSTFEGLKFDAEEKLQKVVEDVNDMIKDVYPVLVVLDEMDDIGRTRVYLNEISLHMIKIKEIEAQIAWINKEEYEDLKNHVHPFYHLMKLCLDVQRNVSVWQDGPFEMLNYESTRTTVDKYHEELTELHKVYRKKLRQAQDENIPLRFKGTVDDPDILNWPAPLKLCGTALKLMEDFKPAVDVMKIICNPNLKKRHWMAISEIAKEDVTPNAGTTLRKIMKIDFQSSLREYEIISTGASKEKQLIDHLEEIEDQWKRIQFTVIDEPKTGEIKILSHLEDIDDIVNDHTIKLATMRSSVFVKPHEKEVMRFYTKILNIKSTIEAWGKVQKDILKLLPIFRNERMTIIAPKETALFSQTSKVYGYFIGMISHDSRIMKIVETTDITKAIEACSSDLEVIDKGIISYLNLTRLSFPRLYFLSNVELLEVVSDPKHALKSGKFLIKLFPGIHSLNTNNTYILGISNSQSEKLEFACPISKLKDNKVETLCSQLEEQMRASLKSQMGNCFKTFKRTDLKNKLPLYCEQILRVVSQIFWTDNMEGALSLTHNIKLRIYYQQLMNNMDDKIKMLTDDLTNSERKKLRSLIVDDINNKALLKNILDSNNIDPTNFEWKSHFKYHYRNSSCHIHILNSSLQYLFEYFGNSFHHIATPLTDRCTRILINAFSMHYNGLLKGYSGTGKSQTIKWLVRSFGGLLIVFHCSKNLTYSTITRLILGSLMCGSWLCLDNFGAIPQGVLSAISQDLSIIHIAKIRNLKSCNIGGTLTDLSPTSFLCACLESESYKRELPLNLKVSFRTMTKLSPELDKIAEALLLSQGFQSAISLSRRTCHVLRFIEDMMPCYNFGLNTLTQILNKCDTLKKDGEEMDEAFTVANCLKEVIFPQIKIQHEKLFISILTDVFPEFNIEQKSKYDLEIMVNTLLIEMNVQPDENLIKNVLQTYENICRRSCIVLVGEAFSGKTISLRVCKKIVESVSQQTVTHHIINPNCFDYKTFYGEIDKCTQKWRDGVFTQLIRDIASLEPSGRTWITLDGTINPTELENISPMLNEDNTFYSDSGESLMLEGYTTTFFEVENLNSSSPSIIAHCVVIYFHGSTKIWKHLVESWIANCSSEWIRDFRNQIFDLFCWIIPPSLEFIRIHCHQLCTSTEPSLVNNMLLLTQFILDEVFSNLNKREEDAKNFPTWIQSTVIQAVVLGLGSILDATSRTKFDEFFKTLWKGVNTEHPHPETLDKLEVALPQESSLFEYQYLYRQRGNWKLYQDILKTEKIVESPYMNDFLVPTADSLRTAMILNMFIKNQKPCILIGPTGTGKTILIEHILINTLNKNRFDIAHINFNLDLESKTTQKFVLGKLNKRKNNVYIPPTGQNFLLFIDNLNQVSTNEFGVSSSTELLRQYLDHKVWYDFNSANRVYLESINIVSAMGLLGGCNKKLSPRFLRHFGIFAINEFTEETITRIYSNSLLHIWKKSGFPGDIATITNQLAQATHNIYKQIRKFCRPTVSRCHYLFSLSSISKITQGCAMLRKETYDANKKIFLKLWVHETLRVFGDRLNTLDSNWLLQKIKEGIVGDFNESFEDHFENNGCPLNKIVFSTINDKNNSNSKKYDENIDHTYLLDYFTAALTDYNEKHEFKLEIVIFQNALEKLLKLSRILSFCPGNALMIGPCASGKQSLTKLACFIHKQKLHQPIITQKYSLQDWNADVKTVLKEVGALENKCVFLVTEEQLISDTFLQNIESLLLNGEIPGLYTVEDKQQILQLARLSAQGGNKNLEISSSSVFLHFNKKCKENLHLILSLSATSDKLRYRLRNYPGIFNCHVICWDDWSNESLQDVAKVWVSSLELKTQDEEKVIDILVYFHRESQNIAKQLLSTTKFPVHVTATAFIHLLKLFIEQVRRKRNKIDEKKKLYLQGLGKLSYAADQISSMQKALAEYQPQLAEMTQKAVQMTEQIALETIEVEKASALVRKDEEIASEQASVAQILKSECEAELAQAIPILEDAISALNTLKPSDITLVKSMKNPPDAIKLVMAAVCVIKDVKPDRIPDPSTGRKTIDYWGPSKRILGDMNFLQTLKDFDKDNIKPEIMVKIRKEYLPHKDFKPHVVAKASSAAEGLCKWIIAMDLYDKVAKEVAPKKEKLENSEREYAATMAILNQKKEEVKRIEEKLAGLKELLDDATRKQWKLQREVDICNKKLGSAQKLIGSLGGEKLRWTEAVESLGLQEKLLCGNVLVSSAIVAYLGPFGGTLRHTIIEKWHQFINELLPCCEEFDIIESFSSQYKSELWLKKGLPNDELFLQNGVIHDCSRLFCVLVDPEYQADEWIKKIERRNDLTIMKLTHDDYLEKLKYCIEVGKPISIHKIKSVLPTCLYQFLANYIHVNNNDPMTMLNGIHIKMSPKFRLYMVSNIADPEFSPELQSKVTIINFGITDTALSDCLLQIVTEIEKPELKKLRKELYSKRGKNRVELAELENKILKTLCESEADILEDENSIKILDQSKDLVMIVREKQKESEEMEEFINNFRNQYTCIPSYVANLYFSIAKLRDFNHIYQFSLKWFMELYHRSILLSAKSKKILTRCENISKTFTYHLYKNISNCLYERDKLTFLFWFAISITQFKNSISYDEINMLLRDDFSIEIMTTEEKLNQLRNLTGFLDLIDNFDLNLWKNYIESPGFDNIPPPWHTTLTKFHQLLITKFFKPHCLLNRMKHFISTELGEEFMKPQYYDISDTYNESYSLSPILFIMSKEINPLDKIQSLAKKKKVLHTLQILSFGPENISEACEMIDHAQNCGYWICLQNCHVVPHWFEILEKKLVEWNFENTHENFRLWLISEATEAMPIELLQNSIKVVLDYPSDFKENLMTVYKNDPISEPDFLGSCAGKHPVFSRLLYGLISFHCALRKRNSFGVFGWKSPFSFTDQELLISIHQLQDVLNEGSFTNGSMQKLEYIIGRCHYGSNIDDPIDFSCIMVLLEQFLNLDVAKKADYKFNNLVRYGLPKKSDYKDYINFISMLPGQDEPEIFGISEITNDFASAQRSKDILSTILNFHSVQEKKTVESNEFSLIFSIEDILKDLPTSLENKRIKCFVLCEEISLYNILLKRMIDTLHHLKQSVGGTVLISSEYEEMAEDIIHSRVPRLWKQYTFPNNNRLSSFVKNLNDRIQFFRNLKENGRHFWLAAFFRPKALLTQTRLNFLSKSNTTLGTSSLEYVVPRHEALIENDEKLWSNDPSIRVVCLDDLKLRIQRFAPQFRGSSQQDAQEFLCYLLEGLHEDVNMAVDEPNPNPKPVLMEIDKSFSFNVDAMDSWSRFLIMNKSKFVDNFVGQLKSTLRCTFCGYCSETFDPFWELSLPIPQRSGQLSLSHCLDSFTSVEILDGEEKPTCSMCREKRKCLKSLFINKFPKILVIHLKRFSQTVEFSDKLNTFVDFPLIGLDMSPYAAEDIVPCPYNLYAISNHSGTTYSGHYTAYCRHLYTKIWHEYNDSLVSSISSNSLVSGDAYILFCQQEAHYKFEQRDVDSVKSYCSVSDPDSTLRTVHYSADNHDMFNTVVEKHETPVYLAPAAHSEPVDIVYSGPVLNVSRRRKNSLTRPRFLKMTEETPSAPRYKRDSGFIGNKYLYNFHSEGLTTYLKLAEERLKSSQIYGGF